MAFENSAEQYKSSEVHQPSTTALLPSDTDHQNFFKPNTQTGSEPRFLDFWQSDIYGQNKYVIASDVELPMPWQIESGLNQAATDILVKPIVEKMDQDRVEKEIQKIPDAAWKKAYSEFPELKEAELSEKQGVTLMKAIIANEVEHYGPEDLTQDVAARAGFKIDPKYTIGVAQLSTKAVAANEKEFPTQLGRFNGHETQALLEPTTAPVLVAATLAHYTKQFEKYNYPITPESLGYAYNPDLKTESGHKDIMPTKEKMQGSEHAANIRRWLSVFSEK
ncbi:MAG: hypothetical protein ACRDHZ_02735 [Ktedonobacteraceae bacterium]